MLKALRAANLARDKLYNPRSQLSLSSRGNELAGETGEACNIIKKLEHRMLGLRDAAPAVGDLADELADVIICVDLIAMDLGINLEQAILRKFNWSSAQRNLPTKLRINQQTGDICVEI